MAIDGKIPRGPVRRPRLPPHQSGHTSMTTDQEPHGVWATTGPSGPHEMPGSLGGSCQVSPSSLQACASSGPPSPPLTVLGIWLRTSCLPDTSHWGRPAPAQSRMFLSIWEKQSSISWVLQPLAHSSTGLSEVIPVSGSIWLKSWIWRPSWAWLSLHMSPSLQIWSYTDSPGLQNLAPGKRAWPFPSGAPCSITRVKSSPSSTPQPYSVNAGDRRGWVRQSAPARRHTSWCIKGIGYKESRIRCARTERWQGNMKVSSRGSSCKMQPGPRELGQKVGEGAGGLCTEAAAVLVLACWRGRGKTECRITTRACKEEPWPTFLAQSQPCNF